ncbi:kinetochore protein NDC80 homolog [Exaiptasia diaphana]|uniref:Kinetochore protein NDC80 n=1 Tax=Exaiptasia diaphana TaxID=2652724 RepID=A0A913Y3P3_EXADI|nr:kinetochore protein NDC80 homolog [Exaiptasia diaphana]KXJ22823.1 Kinetochore protein NDC80-like [Exaiptasia diaphana]
MRRNTLGVLNGNQSARPKDRKSLGPRPSTGRLSTSGRPSISSKRRSSQYGRDNYAQIKDTRNLSDRGVYRKNIRNLMEFLTEFNYPNPISERILSAPPMKEFKKIFLFVYSFIDPNVKEKTIDKRPEEEIPRIFKLLGYPFTISKSSMFSVGSPHTWPNLLGALCWLIELTKFAMKTSENINEILFDEDNDVDKLYFEYLEDSYLAFMKGRELDDLKEFESTLFDKIKERHSVAYKELEELEKENETLEKELAELEGPSRLEALVEKQKSLETDREKFKKYIHDLRKQSKIISDNNSQQDEEILALKMELDALTIENIQRQEILDKQELSPADVQRMKTEKKELMKHLKDLEGNCDYLDKKIWDLEMDYAKLHEEAEQNIREYNETARKLKLVPTTAENANGFDFEMHFNPQQLGVVSHYRDTLKPALIDIKEKITERTRNIQTQIMTDEEALDQLGDLITERREELENLESKQALMDKDFETKKEEMAKQHQTLTTELQERQQELINVKKQDKESTEVKQQQLLQLQERADKRTVELQEEVSEFKEFLVKACHLVMDHKTIMNKSIKEIEERAKQALQETKSLQVPEMQNDN